MRTTFFALALCAATSLAAPGALGLGDATGVVGTLESELPKLPSGLPLARRRRNAKLRVSHELEKELDVNGLVRTLESDVRRSEAGVTSEVESDVGEIVDVAPLGDINAARSVASTVKELKKPVDADLKLNAVAHRSPLHDATVPELEKDLGLPTDTALTPRSAPAEQTDILDKVLHKVEHILSAPLPSATKLQNILNTIISDIEADASITTVPATKKRSLLATLIPDLDSLSLADLLEYLSCMMEALEQSVSTPLRAEDPALEGEVERLVDEVNGVVDEVEKELGPSLKREISAVDTALIDALSVPQLVEEIDGLVARIEGAVDALSPALARGVKHLCGEVGGIVHEVERAAGL